MTLVRRLSVLALSLTALAFAGCQRSSVIAIPPPAPARMFVADITNGLLGFAQPINPNSTASVLIPTAGTIGLAVDSAGNLYVSNDLTNSISVYAPGVTSTSTPTLTFGPIVGAVGLRGMNFDKAGNLYAADNPGSQVFMFAPPFTAASKTPTKTILGPTNPENVVFDRAGEMITGGFGSMAVTVLRPPFANGANVPVATLLLPLPCGGVAIDTKDDLVVGQSDGSLAVFLPPFGTGNTPAFFIAPPTINALTGTEALNGAFDSSGNLWVPYAGFNLPGQPGVAVFAQPFSSSSVPMFSIFTGIAGPFGIAFAP
jgi:hypothetical protein